MTTALGEHALDNLKAIATSLDARHGGRVNPTGPDVEASTAQPERTADMVGLRQSARLRPEYRGR